MRQIRSLIGEIVLEKEGREAKCIKRCITEKGCFREEVEISC